MITRERTVVFQPPTDEQLASNAGSLLVARIITTRISAGNKRRILEDEVPRTIRAGGGVPFRILSLAVVNQKETSRFAAREGLGLTELNEELERRASDFDEIPNGIILGAEPFTLRDGRGTFLKAVFPEGMKREFNNQRTQMLIGESMIPRLGGEEQSALFGICSSTEQGEVIAGALNNPTNGSEPHFAVGVAVSAPQVLYAPPVRL